MTLDNLGIGQVNISICGRGPGHFSIHGIGVGSVINTNRTVLCILNSWSKTIVQQLAQLYQHHDVTKPIAGVTSLSNMHNAQILLGENELTHE